MNKNIYQAIQTRVIPATNTKPTRIKATCERGSLTLSWDSLDGNRVEEKHHEVAKKLAQKFVTEDEKEWGKGHSSWDYPLVTGALKDSYVHVFVN